MIVVLLSVEARLNQTDRTCAAVSAGGRNTIFPDRLFATLAAAAFMLWGRYFLPCDVIADGTALQALHTSSVHNSSGAARSFYPDIVSLDDGVRVRAQKRENSEIS